MININQIGIVLAGHGSRNDEAISQFQTLAALLSDSHKGIIKSGYLEFASPAIGEAIDTVVQDGAETIIVVPVMLNAAHHVKQDIPDIIQAAKKRYPAIPIQYARHLDLHPNVITLYKNKIAQALSEAPNAHEKETLLIILGRGSSDISANKDILILKQHLQEELSFGTILHGYTSAASPLLSDVLDNARTFPCGTILIAPYLLFKGVLMEKIESARRLFQKENTDRHVLSTQTLGPDQLIRDALLDRIREAIHALGHN
ncbi:MAG: sirohydrochlorin chelatase [Nitrospirota bacterium]